MESVADKITGNPQWSEFMRQAYGRAPIGVLGIKFNNSSIEAMFANKEVADMFGFTVEEMERLTADPRESFFLRVWHYDDWKKMIAQHFTALVRGEEKVVIKGRFYHSSGMTIYLSIFFYGLTCMFLGTRFEAIWSVQVAYSEYGVPSSKTIFVTRCDV